MGKTMQSNILLARVSLTLALCLAGWSVAYGATLDDTPQASACVSEVVTAQPAPDVVSGFGTPEAGDRLDGYRGGFDLVKNDMQLSGSVANNSAINVVTGSNFIADGSFSNASGFPMVIQNSGSNVLIQNATIVNLQLQ